MPVHRFESGPQDPDPDVLANALKSIEAKGEEVVQVLPHWLGYPIGEWVIVTRKLERATRPRGNTETRRAQ